MTSLHLSGSNRHQPDGTLKNTEPGTHGNRHNRLTWHALVIWAPLLLTASYALALWLVPSGMRRWFNSEHGPVEITSALVFLVIGVQAARVFAKTRHLNPPAAPLWKWLFAIMAMGGVMMFLEEISYGQHFVGWATPEWFVENSKQPETNLHNLFDDKPSVLLRRIAEIGAPIFAIILPLICMSRKGSYTPPNWPHYLLPRAELIVWVLLAALVRPVRKYTGLTSVPEWRGSLSEFQELLWACAMLVLLTVLLNRFREAQPSPEQASHIA